MAPSTSRRARKKGSSSRKSGVTAAEQRERQLLEGLEQVAEKIGLEVRHDHIQAKGIRSFGGTCRVGEQWLVLIDRRLPTAEKVDLLATELGRFPLDDVFVPPVIRGLIQPAAAE